MKDMKCLHLSSISDNRVKMQDEATTGGTTIFCLNTFFLRYTPFSIPKKLGQIFFFSPIHTTILICHSWNFLKWIVWLKSSAPVQFTAETAVEFLLACFICNSLCPKSTGRGRKRGFLLRICWGDEMGHHRFHTNTIWAGTCH